MRLDPPSDPCMCGSFDTWHGQCYVGLSQSEIDARHKRFVAEWRKGMRTARTKAAKDAAKAAIKGLLSRHPVA